MREALMVLLIAVFSTATTAQVPPPVDKQDTPQALDPLLYQAAKLEAEGKPWDEHVVAHGGHVDDSRLLFEIAEFGQRTPVNGPWPNEGPKIAERLKATSADFSTLQWIPSGSSTHQRGWISPREVLAFHSGTLKVLPFASTSRWVPPTPLSFGTVASEGPGAMRADILNELGTTGSGIKIAVLDLGFQGIASTAAAECGTVSTHPTQSLATLDSHPDESHGTSCVEIVRDMAPDVDILVIDESDPGMDAVEATNYAITWGAQIISRSVGQFGYPLSDLSSQAAATAVGAGIHFVNAAGNHAQKYWESGSYTVGTNDYVRFQSAVELNQIATGGGVTENSLVLSYERPDSSYATYEIELWADYGSGLVYEGSGSGNAAAQLITYDAQPGVAYYAAIWRTSSGTPGRLRLFSSTLDLFYTTPNGSIGNPATLGSVISVGAVSQTNYTATAAPEPYSSRGGGVFNLPLDLCAPTDCSTISAGPSAFDGTSCACPNFAGFLALHLSRPEYAANPYSFMIPVDIGAVGPDDDSGVGIIIAAVDTYESDNTPANATDLGSATTTSSNHALAPANDVDWYVFDLTSPGDVALETTGPSGDTAITLYDATMSQLAYDDDGGTGLFSLLGEPYLPAGTYYVLVDEPTQSAICEYSLTLTITRDAPTAVSLLAPVDGALDEPDPVSLSWTATTSLSPATYQVEVATDSAFNNVVATDSGLTTENGTTAGLQPGTEHWWRVRAQNPYDDSAWSASRSFTTFDPPTDGGGGGDSGSDDGGCSTGMGAFPWWALLAVATMIVSIRQLRMASKHPS